MADETDRELLELAAKAADIELWHEEVFTNGLTRKVSKNGILQWNPLTDDGDALRLAVRLSLNVMCPGIARDDNGRLSFVDETTEADPVRATRRAIVRAAAEIGRRMP